jgi:LDH2 family malate/lactate/ureidoglycolate dehydrogenase
VDGIIRQIRESRPAPGFARAYAPGEVEAETERRHRAQGVPLNAETLAGVRQAAGRVGVSASALPGA